MRLAAQRSRPDSRIQACSSLPVVGRRTPKMRFAEKVRRPAGKGCVFAAAYHGLIGNVASPNEQKALARTRMDERAPFGRCQIEVARQRVGAFGRLAKKDPDVALLDDRLAIVRA